VYDKLGISNRVEVVLYVLTHRGAENRVSAPDVASSERLAMDCKARGQVKVVEEDCCCIPKVKRQSFLEEGTTRASRSATIRTEDALQPFVLTVVRTPVGRRKPGVGFLLRSRGHR
jgi:hypothetical protein